MPTQSNSLKNSYYILVREFNSHEWSLGDIHEVRIDKSVKCSDLGKYLQDKLYPHIPLDSMFGCKVNYLKGFKKGDIPFKRWSRLDT